MKNSYVLSSSTSLFYSLILRTLPFKRCTMQIRSIGTNTEKNEFTYEITLLIWCWYHFRVGGIRNDWNPFFRVMSIFQVAVDRLRRKFNSLRPILDASKVFVRIVGKLKLALLKTVRNIGLRFINRLPHLVKWVHIMLWCFQYRRSVSWCNSHDFFLNFDCILLQSFGAVHVYGSVIGNTLQTLDKVFKVSL